MTADINGALPIGHGFVRDGKTDTSRFMAVNADGSLNVSGSFSAVTSAVATTVAPTYSDGTTNPLNADLNGAIRISGTISASSSLHSTTAAPSYVNGTDNPFSSDLAGNLRVLVSGLGSPFQAGGSIANTIFASTQSGTWNITNVSGTISLPTGASTSALQTTGNTSLTSILTALGSPIQTTGGTLAITNLPTTVDVNSGNKSNSTLRTILATDSVALPAWGHGVSGATAPTGMTQIGLLAKTALPTAVSDAQMAPAMADKFGRNIVRCAPRELLTSATVTTTGTSGTLLAAQGANVFSDIFGLEISNSSAAAVLVSISDGTKTYNYEVPANNIVGFSKSSGDARPATTANTAWTYTVASGTTTIYINADFVLNK